MSNLQLFHIHYKDPGGTIELTITPASPDWVTKEANATCFGPTLANIYAYSPEGAVRKIVGYIRNIPCNLPER